MKILIIIPAYNENKNILKTIQKLKEEYKNYDILVIDDGSTDDTGQLSSGAGVNVLRHPFNMKYGITLQTGYKYALKKGYDCVVQIDADGQHDISYIGTLVSEIESNRCEVCLGSRYLVQGEFKQDTVKLWGTKIFSLILLILTGHKFTDPTSGYQALSKKVLEVFTTNVFPYDYPDADVLLMLHYLGCRIKEIPVKMYPRTEGKSMHSGWKPFYYIFKMLLSIFVVTLRKHPGIEDYAN